MASNVQIVSVFAAGSHGGNPAPIVIDAAGMSDADMQQVARSSGYESGFVLPPPPASDCDFELRFWVPNHEMSMCGHVTMGTLWLLEKLGRLRGNEPAVWTKSGRVDARVRGRTERGATVEISQPVGTIETLDDSGTASILDVLGVQAGDLAPLPIQNASTSRVKTLVPLRSVDTLNGLNPDFTRIEALCSSIGSTGLYPYAVLDRDAQIFEARQFPKSSGYPEDAATGIAASALSFGLLANGMVDASERRITIRQGRAMQRPSEILVRFRLDQGRPDGCWLGGTVQLAER